MRARARNERRNMILVRLRTALILVVVASCVLPLAAETNERAFALFAGGQYSAAAEAADQAGGAENLALAARALNAKAYLADDRKEARRIADEALDYAKAALEENEALLEAHLQAAISLALRGANMSPVRAFFLNLPARARRYIDAALALDPESAWALSTSAAWRLEVARRGGGSTYGADPELGYAEFQMARALDPENISIAYECALRLVASEQAEWRGYALACLDAARAVEPQTAFDRAVKERAGALAAAIEKGPEAEEAFIEAHP